MYAMLQLVGRTFLSELWRFNDCEGSCFDVLSYDTL
jgi:hypothetical protein